MCVSPLFDLQSRLCCHWDCWHGAQTKKALCRHCGILLPLVARGHYIYMKHIHKRPLLKWWGTCWNNWQGTLIECHVENKRKARWPEPQILARKWCYGSPTWATNNSFSGGFPSSLWSGQSSLQSEKSFPKPPSKSSPQLSPDNASSCTPGTELAHVPQKAGQERLFLLHSLSYTEPGLF